MTLLARSLGPEVELDRPSDPAHGDYATNAALQLAGVRGRPPREVAAGLVAAAETLPGVERAEVAGPGFVNLFLADAWFGDALAAVLDAGDGFGAGTPEPRRRIQVELVSANPTGPVTVASARNGAYGDAVARLLAFAGHEVEREYYYNDAGAQLDRFRESVDALRRGEEPPTDGYRGAYVAELAQEPGDAVDAMRRRIEASLGRFRVHIDTWASQSAMEQHVRALLPRLDTYEAEGTLWARTTAHGDDKDRP